MKKISQIIIFLTCVAISTTACNYFKKSKNDILINDSTLLNVAKNLPNVGTLQVTQNGFVYVSVSRDFETKLYPILIKDLSSQEKNCLEKDKSRIGEHISLFYPEDLTAQQFNQLPIGETFKFQVNALRKFTVYKWHNGYRVIYTWYVLSVNSPQLSQLQRQIKPYAIQGLLHISIAVAKRYHNGSCMYRVYW